MKNNCNFRLIVVLIMCISLVIPILPRTVQADTFSYTDDAGWHWTVTWGEGNGLTWEGYRSSGWQDGSTGGGKRNTGSGKRGSSIENSYQYEKPSDINKVIEICKKYNDLTVTTGVRSQINWMNQLFATAVQEFNSKLGLGDTLLIALLNHTDINTALLTSYYSVGDINRVIAKQISDGKAGYVDIDTIAKATGLSAQEVKGIIDRIAAGSITEKTIAAGQRSSGRTNRGPYLKKQAQKQEKVFKYLTQEIKRMSGDPDALNLLYHDLGEGYVNGLLAGTPINQYKVKLYKEHLAKTLDNTAKGIELNSAAGKITGTEAYKVTKKTQSALSKVYKYMVNGEKEALPEELRNYLNEHLKNGVLSDSEARELLILSGEYEKGEHGIGEAAKQLIKGYEHLKKLENVINTSGKVIDAAEKIKKAEEFLEYWLTDYAQQEILLEHMVQDLTNSGADMELMVAAKEIQKEYTDKMVGLFDRIYTELINKGIGTLKSTFPPLGIAEACISLAGTLTGADDHVDAIETGLAMQGICEQVLEDYENAVKAVANGDTSEAAINRVVNNFEVARQSLISYYKAMVELAETDAEKNTYSYELNRLEKAEFGYVTVSLPFGGGNGGSR